MPDGEDEDVSFLFILKYFCGIAHIWRTTMHMLRAIMTQEKFSHGTYYGLMLYSNSSTCNFML